MYLSIGETALFLGVSVSTLRRWDNQGLFLPCIKTCGGHRRYGMSKLGGYFKEDNPDEDEDKVTIGYCRVSSHDQKEDLQRQIKRVKKYCHKFEHPVEIIRDLGSGLNFKKRGLQRLIQLILKRKISKLVLAHRDRLLRFGSELILALCKFFSVEVFVMEEKKSKSDEEELAQDVLEILTVFSARLYGKRSSQNRKLKNQILAS